MKIIILGLSITSSWGNGHATTYRGLVRELVALGCDVLFLERDMPWYAANSDIPNPPYLGGNGWDNANLSANVKNIGHVYTKDHNAFNCTPRAVLNISRESMARYGFSPATRVFEAAGAGACLITDAWEGIELFLEPGREVLVAQNGDEVREHLLKLTFVEARTLGEAARRRVLAEHTYTHRAAQLEAALSQ